MVISESFSVGCPVMTTDNGNAGNIISTSKGGVVYKIGDDTSFYNSLEKVIIYNQFYRNNAKMYLEKELNSKTNYERLRDIYDKCKVI